MTFMRKATARSRGHSNVLQFGMMCNQTVGSHFLASCDYLHFRAAVSSPEVSGLPSCSGMQYFTNLIIEKNRCWGLTSFENPKSRWERPTKHGFYPNYQCIFCLSFRPTQIPDETVTCSRRRRSDMWMNQARSKYRFHQIQRVVFSDGMTPFLPGKDSKAFGTCSIVIYHVQSFVFGGAHNST